jgi:hypothetical protein
MARLPILLLTAGAALALVGCVAGIAANAVGMAVGGARGQPTGNEHLQPEARQACSSRASQYGAVHIIDVEQRGPSRIVVWGTVDDGKQRRSFECGYSTKITGFKLRAIATEG